MGTAKELDGHDSAEKRTCFVLAEGPVGNANAGVSYSKLPRFDTRCLYAVQSRSSNDPAYSPAGDPLRAGGEIANSQAIDSAARALRSPI